MKATAPFGHWATQTFIAGLRLSGMTAPWVLDGAMDPALDYDRVRRDQAVALDKATRRFIRDCSSHRDCPLTGDVQRDMRLLEDLVASLDAVPERNHDQYCAQGSSVAEAMTSG